MKRVTSVSYPYFVVALVPCCRANTLPVARQGAKQCYSDLLKVRLGTLEATVLGERQRICGQGIANFTERPVRNAHWRTRAQHTKRRVRLSPANNTRGTNARFSQDSNPAICACDARVGTNSPSLSERSRLRPDAEATLGAAWGQAGAATSALIPQTITNCIKMFGASANIRAGRNR